MVDLEKLDPTLPAGQFSTYDQEFMLPVLEAIGPDSIYLEVGVDRGKSLAFARTVSRAKVYGIDIKDNRIKKWFKGKDVNFKRISSDDAAKTWKLPIDVLFIDGDHTYEGVKADWDNFAHHVKPGGWVFFHDCDETSPGVVRLFDEIGEGWSAKYKSPNQRCSMARLQRGA